MKHHDPDAKQVAVISSADAADAERMREYLRQAETSLAALEPRPALRAVADALRIARRLRDNRSTAEALSIATLAHYYRGDYAAAMATGLDACAAADNDDCGGGGVALYGMALSFVSVQDYARAESAARRAILYAALEKNVRREGIAFSTLGVALAEGGQLENALTAFRRAILRLRSARDRPRLKRTIFNVGATITLHGNRLAENGDEKAARRLWVRAMRYFKIALGAGKSRLDDINTHVAHAECQMRLGRLEAANEELKAAAARCTKDDLPIVTGYLAFIRGETEYRLGQWTSAERHLLKAIEFLDEYKYDDNPANCRDALARLAQARGRDDEARTWRRAAQQCRDLKRETVSAFRKQMRPLWDRYLKRVSHEK